LDETSLSPALLADLAAALGAEHVSTTVSDRLANSRGVWPIELKQARVPGLPPLPACVVWPGDAQQVGAVRVLRETAADDVRIAFELARLLVDRHDRHYETVFRQVAAIA